MNDPMYDRTMLHAHPMMGTGRCVGCGHVAVENSRWCKRCLKKRVAGLVAAIKRTRP